jgi:hypothetical protein
MIEGALNASRVSVHIRASLTFGELGQPGALARDGPEARIAGERIADFQIIWLGNSEFSSSGSNRSGSIQGLPDYAQFPTKTET